MKIFFHFSFLSISSAYDGHAAAGLGRLQGTRFCRASRSSCSVVEESRLPTYRLFIFHPSGYSPRDRSVTRSLLLIGWVESSLPSGPLTTNPWYGIFSRWLDEPCVFASSLLVFRLHVQRRYTSALGDLWG